MDNKRMPALFIGHGSPMNAIEQNEFSSGWLEAAQQLPKPRAILCVSAHWETRGVMVTAMENPKTIHDFYGFPRALFEKQYPAPGSLELAQQVGEMVKNTDVHPDSAWGLDHGTWSVLCRMYPAADIPVVQLSLDRTQDPDFHYELGRQLLTLRDEGVLILGSGNIVHNLRLIAFDSAPFDWAVSYDSQVKKWIVDGDHDSIIHYEKHGRPAELSVNSGEHYLPLLYVLAQQQKEEPVSFFNEKIFAGSLSMRCVKIG